MQETNERYFSIDILDKERDYVLFNKTSLLNYIKENFPLVYELREERAREYDLEKRRDVSRLLTILLNKLNLPRFVIVKEMDGFLVEPITKTILPCRSFIGEKIIDEELDYYFDYNYDDKIINFFNPSMNTRKDAQLTKDEFIEDRIRLKKERRQSRKKMKIKRKGMNKNDNKTKRMS